MVFPPGMSYAIESEPQFTRDELELIYIALCAITGEEGNPLRDDLLEKIERELGLEP